MGKFVEGSGCGLIYGVTSTGGEWTRGAGGAVAPDGSIQGVAKLIFKVKK